MDEQKVETKSDAKIETKSAEVDNEIQIVDSTQETGKGFRFQFTKKMGIIIGSIVALFIVIYFGVAMYYSERFLPKTTVNGVDFSGKTVAEVENFMQGQVEEYVLSIEERNEAVEEIKGTDIGIQYNGTEEIEAAFEKQNLYAWIASYFKGNDIKAEVDFVYDEAKLTEAIGALACLKEENQEAPVSAAPVYSEGKFVVQKETNGTQINTEVLSQVIVENVDKMADTVNLEDAGCYVAPKYTKDSEEVLAAIDALNKCLEAKITYSLDSIVVTVDKTQISQWISADQDMNLVVAEDAVRAFTDTLGEKYNTKPRTQQITTPTGKVANVSGATKGRVVGSAAECEQLIAEIKEGKVVTRKPVIAQEATPEGQYVWGTNYVEVDISAQHMWYISNGKVVFESDVVTGSPGRDTPAGVFQILTKKRNKTLVGNTDPETGEPEYRTPVDYWARVTWSGIGFHDATWQPAFGGQLYKQGYGSHGCINMPLGAVAQFYEMISVGDPVVIHY